jgi:hypothetical protein
MGDADGNCAVNLADYMLWIGCVTGPDFGPLTGECAAFDLDGDGDADLEDFAELSMLFSAM